MSRAIGRSKNIGGKQALIKDNLMDPVFSFAFISVNVWGKCPPCIPVPTALKSFYFPGLNIINLQLMLPKSWYVII